MSKVIYTAIIGGYDTLVEPDYKPEGWDFVCFTDNDIESKTWQIRKVLSLYADNTIFVFTRYASVTQPNL